MTTPNTSTVSLGNNQRATVTLVRWDESCRRLMLTCPEDTGSAEIRVEQDASLVGLEPLPAVVSWNLHERFRDDAGVRDAERLLVVLRAANALRKVLDRTKTWKHPGTTPEGCEWALDVVAGKAVIKARRKT